MEYPYGCKCALCDNWIGFHGQHGAFAKVGEDGKPSGDERGCVCHLCIAEAQENKWPEADGWRYFFAIV